MVKIRNTMEVRPRSSRSHSRRFLSSSMSLLGFVNTTLSEERRRLSEGLSGIAHHGDTEGRLRAIEAQMATLVRRGLLVKRSLFFIASSVFSFVLTSFLLYLAYVSGAPLDRLFAFLTPLVFLAGMTFLLIGMIAMVLEVAASYSSTLAEVGMGPSGRGGGSG